MQERHIETPRGNVYYWIRKHKRRPTAATLFLHGLTADHTLFDRQIDAFSEHATVIVADLPLHGKSRPYRDFSFRHAAEDLCKLLKEEGMEKVAVVGQSAGGYAAQAIALFHPEAVDAFVFVGSTPFGSKYYTPFELFFSNRFAAIAKLYPYSLYCRLATKNASATPEGQAAFHKMLVDLGKAGMLEAAEQYYKDFIRYEEAEFSCPVLLTIGEMDVTGYVKKYNEMWRERTGYPFLRIPCAAHNANYDNPEFFNRNVLDFLKEILF
jgi:pimeloyl-ACP methyl ester carboxylesterase